MKQRNIYLAGILLAIVLIGILGLGIAKADVKLAEKTAQGLSVVPLGHQTALERKDSKPLPGDRLLDLQAHGGLFAKAGVEKEDKLDGLAKLDGLVKPETMGNVKKLAVDKSLLSALHLTDAKVKGKDLNNQDKLEKALEGKLVKNLRSNLVEKNTYVKNNSEKPSFEGVLYSSPTISSLV